MNILEKFAITPGLCTMDELIFIEKFLLEFQTNLDIYRHSLGEPIGQSVLSNLDKLNELKLIKK